MPCNITVIMSGFESEYVRSTRAGAAKQQFQRIVGTAAVRQPSKLKQTGAAPVRCSIFKCIMSVTRPCCQGKNMRGRASMMLHLQWDFYAEER